MFVLGGSFNKTTGVLYAHVVYHNTGRELQLSMHVGAVPDLPHPKELSSEFEATQLSGTYLTALGGTGEVHLR